MKFQDFNIFPIKILHMDADAGGIAIALLYWSAHLKFQDLYMSLDSKVISLNSIVMSLLDNKINSKTVPYKSDPDSIQEMIHFPWCAIIAPRTSFFQ